MHGKSLWIKASAKYVNANDNYNIYDTDNYNLNVKDSENYNND